MQATVPRDSPTSICRSRRRSDSDFRRHRASISTGPYLSRLLRAKVPRTAPYTIRNWDTGICIGFDFIVGHFVIGPEVQYGLLRVTSSGNEHNIGYSFTVGYRF